MPGPDAQPQEMPLELAGDEAVGGADEVQHLDDLAVGRHGALGGGDDDGGGGGADQQQDGEAAERERARDGADLLLPAAVVVERNALGTARQARCAAPSRLGGVLRSSSRAIRRGTGSVGERVGLPEPWLQQLGRVGDAQRTHAGDAGLARQEAAHVRDQLVDVGTLLGLDLHSDFAGDIAQPGGGRLVHHVDRAGSQAGEKAHDGDDERQRAAVTEPAGTIGAVGLRRIVAPAASAYAARRCRDRALAGAQCGGLAASRRRSRSSAARRVRRASCSRRARCGCIVGGPVGLS